MAGPEGFACGSRVVVAVSFGPKVYKFFLPVLAGFYHALLARPCARARLIAGHAGFSEWHNKILLIFSRDTRYLLDFFQLKLDKELPA